nr:sugar ABC transporter permease [uncultured Eisenbergiella sp.]
MLRKKQYPVYFALPGIFLFLLFFIVPFLMGFRYSFTNWNFRRADFVGLENYVSILKNPNMSIAFKNTFLFTIVTTAGKVSIGMLLAVLLNRKLKTTNYLRTVFYMPAVVNSIAVGIVFTSLMHPSKGLINTALRAAGLTGFQPKWLTDTGIAMLSICFIEIWKWSGYTMMILLAGMQNISKDYYEAALMDGATKWQQFTKITVPLLMASINNVVVLSIIGGLKVFDIVVATTGGGPGYATEVFNTMIYNSYSYQKYGEATAGTTLLAVMILIITLCTYRTIAKNEVEV